MCTNILKHTGERLQDSVFLLKRLLADQQEPEQAWLVYRKVVAEFTSVIKKRMPDSPTSSLSFSVEVQRGGAAEKNGTEVPVSVRNE